MSDNNGQQNAHDNAFSNGKNPGIGGVTGGGISGGGSGGSGSSGPTGMFTGWCPGPGFYDPVEWGSRPNGEHAILIKSGMERCSIKVQLGDKGNSAGFNTQGKFKKMDEWTPKPGDWNCIENGYSGSHQSGALMESYLVRVNTCIYDIIVMNGKVHFTSYVNVPATDPGRSPHKIFDNYKSEAQQQVMDYLDFKDAVYQVSTFYKEMSNKFGAALSKEAEVLAEAAKGKKLRNVDEAIAAFNRYKDVLNKKYSVADREAIARALESMDMNQMAKQLTTFGKAFGLVNNAIDAYDMGNAIAKGVRTGDWNDAFRTAERLTTSKVAAAAVAFAFAALTTTPMGIVGYALIMAFTSALIDDALMDRINKFVLSLV